MQRLLLFPIASDWSSGKFGLLPPPLWGRAGEGGGAYGNVSASISGPPPPTPPQPKSGLPDFGQSNVPNPGQPGFGGEGSTPSTGRCSASSPTARALTLVGAVAALVLGAATPLNAQTAGALPQGEGRELVATACSQCHTLNVIMAGRDGPVGWKKHVYNMVLRGAQLTPREADTVIQYLISNFGPGAPAATTTALPGGPGKELVETRCAVCHNLERVTVVKRQKRDWETVVANMYERSGMSAPDEVKAISAYLVAQFGRD